MIKNNILLVFDGGLKKFNYNGSDLNYFEFFSNHIFNKISKELQDQVKDRLDSIMLSFGNSDYISEKEKDNLIEKINNASHIITLGSNGFFLIANNIYKLGIKRIYTKSINAEIKYFTEDKVILPLFSPGFVGHQPEGDGRDKLVEVFIEYLSRMFIYISVNELP